MLVFMSLHYFAYFLKKSIFYYFMLFLLILGHIFITLCSFLLCCFVWVLELVLLGCLINSNYVT